MANTINRKQAIIGVALLAAACGGGGGEGEPNEQLIATATPSPTPSPTPTQVPTPPFDLHPVFAAGGVIRMPAGTYIVDDPPLTVPAGTTVQGAGMGSTVLKYNGATHLLIDADRFSMSNLTLDGSLYSGMAPFDTFDLALLFLEGASTTYTQVTIQNAPSFGAFVFGGSPTMKQCVFDNNGRTNGQDSLGADHANAAVLYDSNTFTNCHGNAIDNCGPLTGTWSNNQVLSVAGSVGSGDIVADGGAAGVVIQNNNLTVGSIKVYGATPGCVTSHGLPTGNQVVDNVIEVGVLCTTPDCSGLYVISGNSHHGNIVAGVHVD